MVDIVLKKLGTLDSHAIMDMCGIAWLNKNGRLTVYVARHSKPSPGSRESGMPDSQETPSLVTDPSVKTMELSVTVPTLTTSNW